jgi:hypothetical protein
LTPDGKVEQIMDWTTQLSEGDTYQSASIPTRMYYKTKNKNSRPQYYGEGMPAPNAKNIQDLMVANFKSKLSKWSTLSDTEKSETSQHYTNWLEYLYSNVKHLSKDWPQHWKTRQVVCVVPNAWEFDQRIMLKEAIEEVGWVEDKTNIKFLRECEATLNCLIETNVWTQEV